MPFMGDSDWSAPSTGEWSDSLYMAFPAAKSKAREAKPKPKPQPQRPAYMKHKNHASMPHLGQAQQYVFRPATHAASVDAQRHPPATKPALKRSQSLTTRASQPVPEHQQKVEKHVHFVDEGYGSASTSPATSPKQEPKSDHDSRPSTADSDFEQLASSQQQHKTEPPSKPRRSRTDAQLAPITVTPQSTSPTRGAKGAAALSQAKAQHVSRQRLSRTSTAPASAASQGQDSKIAGTGGSYRNANGNICFDEFSYFGAI
ncbi:translation initiation factor if-2 [Diplodia corticola]|uniref:Translation initiation factor if-2 n=1 Tax=Diplodia corticola TaxID=236234 RepID=A0A1J9S2G1_9PEZI|nr:translation initiation factor if-2 [Diplodia corticola]OJD34196.1 translation initiation factor if-2 [Diplodia corticola]